MAERGNDRPRGASRAFLSYNLMRLGLLLAALGVGWLASLRGLVLLVSALAVSGLLSWFLLGRQRVAFGMAVEQSVTRSRLRDQLTARVVAEDAYAEAVHAAAKGEEPPSA
jgi:Protein of unknown function (DUF4229)